jgi:hypothetical protein
MKTKEIVKILNEEIRMYRESYSEPPTGGRVHNPEALRTIAGLKAAINIVSSPLAKCVAWSDSKMLDYVAEYLTGINTLFVKGKRLVNTIEVVICSDDSMVVIRRTGKTEREAFRKCLRAAMKQIPARK